MTKYIRVKPTDHWWRDKANCKKMDINLFFPERGVPYSVIKSTKQICLNCPVMLECLEMILNTENDNFGIFGGTTPKERRQIRSQRANGDIDFLPARLISDYESTQTLAVGVKTKASVA